MEVLNQLVSFFKYPDTQVKEMEITAGKGYLTPVVETPFSESLGAGFICLKEQGYFSWQVLYDEILFVVSGELEIVENGHHKIGTRGDIFFLKEGAEIMYKTPSQTEFFYSIYPANWREIRGLK